MKNTPDQKNTLENIYRNHHESRGRYGYLFCHGKRIPYLLQWIGKGKRVLDLGCRDGLLTQGYAKENVVVGVDIDRKALDLAEKRLGIETHWLDLNYEWPFAKESFDVIVACEILEHIYFADLFLEKILATLKPGGTFIGSVPNAFRMRNRMKFLFGNPFENDPTHVRMFSCTTLKDQLSKYFTDIKIVPIQGKVLPFLKVSEALPLALNRLFAKDLLWCAKKN